MGARGGASTGFQQADPTCLPSSLSIRCPLQDHASRLREAEILSIQLAVEREVLDLEGLRAERAKEGTAGRRTQSLLAKIRLRHNKIRHLMSAWEAWQTFMQPPGAPSPEWDEDAVFANQLPWQPHTAAAAHTQQSMELVKHKTSNELERTKEELAFLETDPTHLLDYYAYQERAILRHCWQAHLSGALEGGMSFVLASRLRQVRDLSSYARRRFIKVGLLPGAHNG